VLRKPGGLLEIERLQLQGPHDNKVLVRLAATSISHPYIDFCESGLGGAVSLG